MSEKVKIEVFSPSGETINEKKDFTVASLNNVITIEVKEFRTTLDKPAEPKKPETRRIRGRVIERRGRQLPSMLQVLLLGHERGTPDTDSLTPVFVAKADSSGYFSGAIKNLEFDRVVAVITGIPGDIPVQLVDWLVPSRIPIVVELPDTPLGPSSKDCGCSNSALPRTPTQDDIAEEPGVFSADLGTGQCIRFNVPNRAIEEFNFHSVVRTTEPQVVGITVGVRRDEPVEVPKPSIRPEEVPEVIAKAIELAHVIETAITVSLTGLTWDNAQIIKAIRPNRITWGEIESLFRIAVIQAEGTPLPPEFFESFPTWGDGEVWDSLYFPPVPAQGLLTAGYALTNLRRFGEVVKKASLIGATLPSPPPGVPQYRISPMTAVTLDPDLVSAIVTRTRDGRVVMNKATPVDWDDAPTFHQAASISHGHLLHFKQVWYADGYSLGDLLYSLPLAPGQKKLISVVDWERREQTTREEFTSAEEGLQAALSRDRDLNEIVTGALSESSRGESHNTTKGAGFGKGSAVSGSYQGFNFGGVMGVSGGFGSGDSNAFQASSRDLSSSSLQTLRDRTLQSASAVRNLRSTIVQTARQGETVRATTEVVANHNHCHALTIQYFEVLRHFKVTHELANVQECLFVPFPMSEFTRPKVRRWRESLSTYLIRPELAPAFDATRRIETGWSEQYTPAARYADERVSAIFGELTLTVFIPLPPFPEKPIPKPGETLEQIEAARRKALAPAEDAFRIISGILTLGASEITRAAVETTKAVAQDARAMAESLFDEPSAEERYARFQQEVMPAAAAGFVDQLELYALVGNSERRLDGADFTMVSEYRPGTPLLVSVRGRITTPVTRASIAALVIKSGVPLPAGCRVIVNSASLRYQTDNFRHEMINDQRVNDDIDLPIVASTGTPTVPGLPVPLPPGFPVKWKQNQIPGVTPIRGGNGAMLYAPLDEWEQRSPRHEDLRLSAELVEHLNANLEYYHHAIWWTMDPNRRYMLLDGYQAPNATGRSVASVVDNTLIGIVGNSLILPVAPGNRLDPIFRYAKGVTLLEHYDPQLPAPPSRVSLPTRGVFAEAVMGDCNACEEIDDTRFWRWEDSPIDEPPTLDMAAMASRRSEPNYGTPTPFPTPIVNIQNAPQAPEPAGVKAALDAIAKQSFADITGLAGTQANAAAAFSKAMDTALAFGKEASQLAQQASMTKNIGQNMRAIDKAESENKIDKGDAKQLRTSALRTMTGDTPNDPKAASVVDRLKVIADQEAGGNITPEMAAQRRAEVMKGLEPEYVTKMEESRAATDAIRRIPGVSSVEIGETVVRAAADTVKAPSGELTFPWLWVEQTFVPAGSGWRRYGGIAVDEPLAVGQQGISDAERMRRALDIEGNRQFKDWIYNSATSRELEEFRIGLSETELPEVSLKSDALPTDPRARLEAQGQIWRRDLRKVKEWRELAQFIRQRIAARIANVRSPGKVKEIINEAIRKEIKNPSSDNPAGQAIHDAIKATTGMEPKEIFRPETTALARWAKRVSVGALKSILAGALAQAAMEYLSGSERQQMADAYWKAVDEFVKMDPQLSEFAVNNPDQGTLLELRIERTTTDQITESRFRGIIAFHGTSHEEVLAWATNSPRMSVADTPLTTIETSYIWLPPLNEQEESTVTVLTPL